MADRLDDVAEHSDLASRWCALAEQRLEYLTQLFESERWRRYYSELAFLQNIQEAKIAVETWRKLSVGGAIASTASDTPIAAEPVVETAAAMEAETTSSDVELPPLQQALQDVEEQVLDLPSIERRYPLLRNVL